MEHSAYYEQRTRLEALERKYAPKLRVALIRSAEPAIEAVLAGADGPLAAARVSSARLTAVLAAMYSECGLVEAQLTYDSFTSNQKALAPPAVASRWGERLKAFITREGAAAVKGITDTTRKLVRDVLNEAAAAGDGVKEVAKKLRAQVAALAPERARAIVRTELLTASSYGSLAGAQATGLQLDKVWLSAPGVRTRPSHQAANGQRANLQDGFFVVGGESARYPGDPILSPAERVNCRCTIIYKPKILA